MGYGFRIQFINQLTQLVLIHSCPKSTSVRLYLEAERGMIFGVFRSLQTFRPLSRSSLERKFMNFAVPVVGKVGAERVVSLVDGLEELKDVRELTQALKGTGQQNLT